MTDVVAPRRPTIRQVAELANVSHQTVSRYLREDPGMREEVRSRIADAVTELNYRPNVVARAMRARRSGRLALVLPLGTAVGSLAILEGARAEAEAEGLELEALFFDGGRSGREHRILEFADAGFFDGLVSLIPLPAAFAGGPASATPVLFTGDYDEDMRSIGTLAGADAIGEMIEMLAKAGHRRFLHMAGGYLHTSGRNRRDAYLAAIERLGLESYGVVDCHWEHAAAREAIVNLPADSGVTAVITANDQLAAGVARGALERGWRIPEDLVVTGWDNHIVGAVLAPSLTTVETFHEIVGRNAVRRLIGAIRGDEVELITQPLTRVIWRESTGDLSAVLAPADV